MNTPQPYLLLSVALFVIGLTVTIIRRHPIVVLLGIELAFQGINLAVGALTSRYQDWDGQVMVLVGLTISAVEFILGLGIASRLVHRLPQEEQE